MSFTDMGGSLSDEDTGISRAILSGDFTKPSADLDEESSKDWELAKMWNSVLRESVALAPSQIDGVDGIRDLMRFQMLLCPYPLSSPSALEETDDEKKAELRVKAEADLLGWLEEHGF